MNILKMRKYIKTKQNKTTHKKTTSNQFNNPFQTLWIHLQTYSKLIPISKTPNIFKNQENLGDVLHNSHKNSKKITTVWV